jgi:Putative transposase/Transposase zinc-binding domain
MPEQVVGAHPLLEVADVIRSHGEAFLQKYGSHLTPTQKKALRDLAVCRTAALGGHVERCLDCGHERPAYNSCRNRHCPKCQALSRARWLERESGYLLPVEYHHVVFTLPAELAELATTNAAAMYNLLMQSAAETLREVAAKKRLGAQIGVLMVLHTWGQNLHHHPHVHCVVTGGGLSCNERGEVDASPRWVSCRPGFFLPVRVLNRVYRGKFLAGLRALHAQGKLKLPALLEASFTAWLNPLYAKDWVVYAKPPFGGPEQVLKYLARYTHRVALSNHRLVKLEDGKVTFRYRDYADSRKEKLLALSAEEFLRRFVQHVLPKGFMKIRHYGLLSSRQREARLRLARKLLLAKLALQGSASTTIEPTEPACCPQCGSVRRVRGELLPRVGMSPFGCGPEVVPLSAPGRRHVVADTSLWSHFKIPSAAPRPARALK